jgi:hypothetical protein
MQNSPVLKDKLTEKTQFEDYKFIHDRFVEKLDEKRSPLSTIIWFGKYKGHEMRQHYKDNAPKRWRWLLDNTDWRPDLEEIKLRHERWLARRPPRKARSKSTRDIVNPKGELLGSWNDEPTSSDESYERNSFCVSSSSASSESRQSDGSGRAEILADDHDRSPPAPVWASSDSSENSQECHSTPPPKLPNLNNTYSIRRIFSTNLVPIEGVEIMDSQQNSSQELSPSNVSQGETETRGRKRKCDSMLNLTWSASQRERDRLVVLPGTKRSRGSRRSITHQLPPSERLPTTHKPLGNRNANIPTSSSRSAEEKSINCYLPQDSSGTIVVQMPSAGDSVPAAPKPKRKKKLTQAPAGVQALFFK